MNIPAKEFSKRMADEGVYLRTGPFTVHVCSSIDTLSAGLAKMYSEYVLPERPEFCDFHISLKAAGGLRRWYRPQVNFYFDGFKPFMPLPLEQAFPMFEWSLNWCIANHAHQYLIVHAAVVEKNEKAVILPAPPGSGKSTLCAALVSRGWRLLSDELALLSVPKGELIPIPRPVNLKNESIDIMQSYAPDAVFSPRVHDTNKGTVALMKAPLESVSRSQEWARPALVILPKYVPGASPELKSRSKARTCLELGQNSFNFSVLGQPGFDVVADLVDRCDCYEFSYSQLDDAISIFNQLVGDSK